MLIDESCITLIVCMIVLRYGYLREKKGNFEGIRLINGNLVFKY